jgi:Bacteriophage baseplate protein W
MALPVRHGFAPFLGRGWSFPPSFSIMARSVVMVEGIEDIRQSLAILMATAPGERVMVPTYGCDLRRFLFRELTTSSLSQIRETVTTAIVRWEPRIDLLDVTAAASGDEPGLIIITLDFRVRLTNVRTNLVYPFYLTEATLAVPS